MKKHVGYLIMTIASAFLAILHFVNYLNLGQSIYLQTSGAFLMLTGTTLVLMTDRMRADQTEAHNRRKTEQ